MFAGSSTRKIIANPAVKIVLRLLGMCYMIEQFECPAVILLWRVCRPGMDGSIDPEGPVKRFM